MKNTSYFLSSLIFVSESFNDINFEKIEDKHLNKIRNTLYNSLLFLNKCVFLINSNLKRLKI